MANETNQKLQQLKIRFSPQDDKYSICLATPNPSYWALVKCGVQDKDGVKKYLLQHTDHTESEIEEKMRFARQKAEH
jgi:hypothetical protein